MTDPGQGPHMDPVVGRVNELSTTLFDVAGVCLLAVAAWVGCGDHLWPGAQWVASAAVLLVGSTMAQFRARPRRVRRPTVTRHDLPGPTDPGTFHVAGR